MTIPAAAQVVVVDTIDQFDDTVWAWAKDEAKLLDFWQRIRFLSFSRCAGTLVKILPACYTCLIWVAWLAPSGRDTPC